MLVRRINVAGANRIIGDILELQGPWGVVEWVGLRKDDDPPYYLMLLKTALQSLNNARQDRAAMTIAEAILELTPDDTKLAEWLHRRYVRIGDMNKAEAIARNLPSKGSA